MKRFEGEKEGKGVEVCEECNALHRHNGCLNRVLRM